jgi:hypothetical protein
MQLWKPAEGGRLFAARSEGVSTVRPYLMHPMIVIEPFDGATIPEKHLRKP